MLTNARRLRADIPLVSVLRTLPNIDLRGVALEEVLERAEIHGLAGVVLDAAVAQGLRPHERYRLRETARMLDHKAHLAVLERIDEVFAQGRIPAVALKGPLLAERYYACPAGRATSDLDLMVAESDLEVAKLTLERVGFVPSTHPSELRFRREHHHLHFTHPEALPLELHFHAYRGFGRVLPSEPLIERRQMLRDYATLGVLAPEDELVYLGVHGAAHRFTRLSWLFDLKLLVERMTVEQLTLTKARAKEWGFARPVAYAMTLLSDVFGVAPYSAFDELGSLRKTVLSIVTPEPKTSILRSATRFIYTTALCDSPRAAVEYMSTSSRGHIRRLARLE